MIINGQIQPPTANRWVGHAVVDLETSGLPEAMGWKRHEDWDPEVLEVGAAMIDGSATFRTHVQPSTDVWYDWRCKKALAVNNITREQCAEAPTQRDAAYDLQTWAAHCGVHTLWCWRAGFDFWFLRRGEWGDTVGGGVLAGLTQRDAQAEVTALLTASGHVPASKRGVSLQTAYALTAERTGQRWDADYHSALGDAQMTGRIIRCLL